MKIKFINLLILLSININTCYSKIIVCDTIKSGVELQIKITQKFEDGKYKSMAISTTVVNNTGKKVYVPRLGFFVLGLSIYKKIGGVYANDKSLFTEIYESKNETNSNIVISNNPIIQEYSKKVSEYFEKKDMILIQECESKAKKREECSMFNIKSYDVSDITHRDFLNPDESIEFLSIRGLEKLVNIKGDFKIAFDFEKSLKFINGIKQFYLKKELYHDIMGYDLFLPENMTSNVVYITIL